MKVLHAFSFIVFITLFSCSHATELYVPYSNADISYSGRIDSSGHEGAALHWSGSSVKMNFEGQSLKVMLHDELGKNYYNVLIDNDSAFLLRLDDDKRLYDLASDLAPGKHTVEIFKRTEWTNGQTIFYGFQIQGNSKLLAKSPLKTRSLEFYGNSITAGYAVEDTSGDDCPDSTLTNNYLSYAAITARHYDAEYSCICKSGIGIMISWFPFIMPDIYDRLNPNDKDSQWDFSNYTPDVVVVNLFQNDSWLVNHPNRKEFKDNFGDARPTDAYIINAYQEFISDLRGHYPQSSIVCLLGNMDVTREGSKWIGYVSSAVANMQDDKIYTHAVPYKNTPGHPSIKEQENLANSLIEYIDANVPW